MADAPESGDEDDQEIVCRICRVEGEEGWPLYAPCKCSGSIKFVHQDCLQLWLQHSSSSSCELCKHSFAFTPLYAPDAPNQLPPHEFVAGLVARAANNVWFLMRLVVVAFVWLVIIPVGTCWISRLLFVRSVEEVPRALGKFRVASVPADCVCGCVLSVVSRGPSVLACAVQSARRFERMRAADYRGSLLGDRVAPGFRAAQH